VSEPAWVTDREAVAINERLVLLFGGLQGGARDDNLLGAALARPVNKWHYDEPRPDMFALAAAYCFAIARGHVFHDGNKRTAHAVAAVFLENNGHLHEPEEGDVVAVMVGAAEGRIGERKLAAWVRATTRTPGGEAASR
jgi:death-on-curing protein